MCTLLTYSVLKFSSLSYTFQHTNTICILLDLSLKPEKAMAPHSSTLAWKIPWTEKPGRLQSMGSLRVGYDWATSLSHNPLQCSCLENPRDGESWWAAVYGVAQSWAWLKRLSSSSSVQIYTYVITRTFLLCNDMLLRINYLFLRETNNKYTFHTIFTNGP